MKVAPRHVPAEILGRLLLYVERGSSLPESVVVDLGQLAEVVELGPAIRDVCQITWVDTDANPCKISAF